MAKARIQARVDDTRKREVKQFADERDITQSEAVRLLVGRGIDYERDRLKSSEDEDEDEDEADNDQRDGTRPLADQLARFAVASLGILAALVISTGVSLTAGSFGFLGLSWQTSASLFGSLAGTAAMMTISASSVGVVYDLWRLAGHQPEGDSFATRVGVQLKRVAGVR
jgi:antitoxin component of RelBE/YafQ-DinJ toxin-antitoxin module